MKPPKYEIYKYVPSDKPIVIPDTWWYPTIGKMVGMVIDLYFWLYSRTTKYKIWSSIIVTLEDEPSTEEKE